MCTSSSCCSAMSSALLHPVFRYPLAGHFLCPWRHSPTRVGLGRWESQQALTQIGNKGEAGMRLKFHLGTQPSIQCACLGASWHENWSQRTKDGKCYRPRQANNSPHTQYQCAAFQLLTSNSTYGCHQEEKLYTSAMHRQVSPFPEGDWVSSRLSSKSGSITGQFCEIYFLKQGERK